MMELMRRALTPLTCLLVGLAVGVSGTLLVTARRPVERTTGQLDLVGIGRLIESKGLEVEVTEDEVRARSRDYAFMLTVRCPGAEPVHTSLMFPRSKWDRSDPASQYAVDLVFTAAGIMDVPPDEAVSLVNWAVLHPGDPREAVVGIGTNTLRAEVGEDVHFWITRNR